MSIERFNMSTVMVFKKWIQGFTAEEIALALSHDNLDALQLEHEKINRKTKHPMIQDAYVCEYCKGDILYYDNAIICGVCGVIDYNLVSEYIPEIWRYKKTTHSRRRWFLNKLKDYVDSKYARILVDDFMGVVSILESRELIKGRNVSSYIYYIIRTSSRRNIPLIKQAKDVRTTEVRNRFDDALFGRIPHFRLGQRLRLLLLSKVVKLK